MGKRYGRKKGDRRSHLKQYSAAMVNTGRGPNKVAVDEYKARTYSLKDKYPDPSVALDLRNWEEQDKFNPNRMIEIPDAECPPRVVTARKIRAAIHGNTGWKRIISYHRIEVKNNGHECVAIYYEANEYFIVRTDKLRDAVGMTRNYYSMSHALRVAQNNLFKIEQEISPEAFKFLSG